MQSILRASALLMKLSQKCAKDNLPENKQFILIAGIGYCSQKGHRVHFHYRCRSSDQLTKKEFILRQSQVLQLHVLWIPEKGRKY
jgi:hypothetical protein